MSLPCASCFQPCCSMLGNPQWNALGVGVAVLPNGDCEHLQDDGKCGIYERRPAGCRSFVCNKDSDFQKQHPELAELLTA